MPGSTGAGYEGVDWLPDGRLVYVTGFPETVVHIGEATFSPPPDTSYWYLSVTPDGRILAGRHGTETYYDDLGFLSESGSFTSILPAGFWSLDKTSSDGLGPSRMSPDGSRVAVHAQGAGHSGLMTVDPVTKSVREFPNRVSSSLFSLAWTTNERLVFAESRQVLETPIGDGCQRAITARPDFNSDESSYHLDVFGTGELQPQSGLAQKDQPGCASGAPRNSVTLPRTDSSDRSGDSGSLSAKEESELIAESAHQSGRSVLATALRAPGDVSTELGLILANVLLALGLVLLVFPATLFESTYEDNYDEIPAGSALARAEYVRRAGAARGSRSSRRAPSARRRCTNCSIRR